MSSAKNEARRFKFNMIDIILILIFVGALGALAYIFVFSGSGGKTQSEPVQIIYEVEIKNVLDVFKGRIAVGDTVVDSVKRYTIGEVIDVRYEDSEFVGVNSATGELVPGTYPGRTNIIMTVRATADTTPGYYSIDGYKLLVGSAVYFRVPDYTGGGYCITVNEVKK